jgi:hypothetical protein
LRGAERRSDLAFIPPLRLIFMHINWNKLLKNINKKDMNN